MGFDINNFLNAESKKEVKSDWKPVKLSVHKLRPAAGKENFYHMDDKEIEETARTIELVGIPQPAHHIHTYDRTGQVPE